MDAIKLERHRGRFKPKEDPRPRVEVPPPVRLEAIADCVLPAAAGLERDLDEFYVGVLEFERDDQAEGIVYRAENFRLRIDVLECGAEHKDCRPLPIAVPLLVAVRHKLTEREIEFEYQRRLMPGTDSLLVYDPAGNPLQITEFRVVI